MTYRDEQVDFTAAVERGLETVLKISAVERATDELRLALREAAQVLEIPPRWWSWRTAADLHSPWHVEEDLVPNRLTQITVRDLKIGTLAYVGPGTWSCCDGEFPSARRAIERMLREHEAARFVSGLHRKASIELSGALRRACRSDRFYCLGSGICVLLFAVTIYLAREIGWCDATAGTGLAGLLAATTAWAMRVSFHDNIEEAKRLDVGRSEHMLL